MNEALKRIAVEAGFVGMEHAFASRSLRIGGATAMIAAGKSRETVKRAGGWAERSEVDKINQQFTPADTGALAIPEVHFDALGIEQVKMMLPPTFWDEVGRRRETSRGGQRPPRGDLRRLGEVPRKIRGSFAELSWGSPLCEWGRGKTSHG